MITALRRIALLVPASALLLAAGCARSPTARLYVLDPSAPRPTEQRDAATRIAVGLMPVTPPAYLDRPQVTTRDDAGQIRPAEFERWAEPLAEGLSRTLATDIERLNADVRILPFPWSRAAAPAWTLRIHLKRFDGVLKGEAALEAAWTLEDARTVLQRSEARFTRPAGGDHASYVTALNRLLADCAARIAADLGQCSAGACNQDRELMK